MGPICGRLEIGNPSRRLNSTECVAVALYHMYVRTYCILMLAASSKPITFNLRKISIHFLVRAAPGLADCVCV